MSYMYLSDSSDDEILRPNGFMDVAEDLVVLDDNEDDLSPPVKKTRTKENSASDQVDLSLVKSSETSNVIEYEDAVSLLKSSEDSSDSTDPFVRKTRAASKKRQKRKRSRPDSSVPIDLESESIVSSSQDSPFNISLTPQTSFSFDMSLQEEAPSISVPEDPNCEVTVRVNWKGWDVNQFTLRKFQKIKEIFTHYAKLEGVDEERILLTFNEKPVSPNDTPHSLNINLSHLEGGVIDAENVPSQGPQDSAALEEDDDDPNKIKLYVQRKNNKEKHSICILRGDKMSVMLPQLAEDLKIPLGSIKLMFDGEPLNLEKTAAENDLDGEECLDLIEK